MRFVSKRRKSKRLAREDELIAAGLDDNQSLARLMQDLGVTELLYRGGPEEEFGLVPFDMDDLDRQVMAMQIGSDSYADYVELLTPNPHADMFPPDAVVHAPMHVHPTVVLWGEPQNLVDVRCDRRTKSFQVTVKPEYVADFSRSGRTMSIKELRVRVGKESGLGGPWQPGTKPFMDS